MKKITIALPIPDERQNICYRVGCNHFWLCWTHDPKIDGDDKSMKNCQGYIGNKEKISYRKFKID